jgi:hypothetical protein
VQYVLVLQWPARSDADLDALIDMEAALEDAIPEDCGATDGHDFGSREMNIFIHTDQPLDAFGFADACLRDQAAWSDVRVAYRSIGEETYTIIRPNTLDDFSVS